MASVPPAEETPELGDQAMQIDIEMAARIAPGGMGAEVFPVDRAAEQRLRRVLSVATVLATAVAVLLASCLAVMMGLS
jgi:hypothetical protein